MNKREEQSEYVPPDNALFVHGMKRQFSHETCMGAKAIERVNFCGALYYTRRCSGIKRREIRDENYEGTQT